MVKVETRKLTLLQFVCIDSNSALKPIEDGAVKGIDYIYIYIYIYIVEFL